MGAKKILMIVGDFAEDYEVMVPFEAHEMVGHTVHAVCPDKQSGETIRTAVHEFEGEQTYSEKPGHKLALNASFSKVDAADYDALVLPGGRAPEYLRLNPEVIKMVTHFADEEKPIAAIFHGLQILAAAGVLRERSCAAYPAVGPEINSSGGKYVDIEMTAAYVDGNLISAPVWMAHPAWLAKFLEALGTKIEP